VLIFILAIRHEILKTMLKELEKLFSFEKKGKLAKNRIAEYCWINMNDQMTMVNKKVKCSILVGYFMKVYI